MIIRMLEEKDNAQIASVIRQCLTEYGCAGMMDTAWGDSCLDTLSKVYVHENDNYWVALNEDGKIVAGVGIGQLKNEENICELQKMYCLPEYRGTGISKKLLDTALTFAAKHYKKCYLETRHDMDRARHFYEKNGFVYTELTLGSTGHGGCDSHYIKEL